MPVIGDFAALRTAIVGLSSLAKPATRRELNLQLAEEARHLVWETFHKEREPGGRSWPALKSRSGRALRDTGRLFNSISRSATASGFRVFTNVRYAATHNYGATIVPVRAKMLTWKMGRQRVWAKKVVIPRRQFIPSGGSLPVSWHRRFEAIAKKLAAQKARGQR